MRSLFLTLFMALFAAAMMPAGAQAAANGISGEWIFQENGQTLTIDEQARTLTMQGGKSSAYSIERESEGGIRITLKSPLGGLPPTMFLTQPQNDIVVIINEAVYSHQLLLRKGVVIARPDTKMDGVWMYSVPSHEGIFDFKENTLTTITPGEKDTDDPVETTVKLTRIKDNPDELIVQVEQKNEYYRISWLTANLATRVQATKAEINAPAPRSGILIMSRLPM